LCTAIKIVLGHIDNLYDKGSRNMFASSYVELLELTQRIMDDDGPKAKADAIIMYGQTKDNEDSIFLGVKRLYEKNLAERVVFGQGGKLVTRQDYLPDYQTKLIQLGIPSEAIIPLQITEALAHTHTEALAHIAHAKMRQWKNVYVVASPFHQLRAFVNTVSIVLRQYPELKVFSVLGTHLPWMDKAIHSQNVESGKRFELIQNEWKRIEAYHAKGDLVSARQVLDYLNQRDQ